MNQEHQTERDSLASELAEARREIEHLRAKFSQAEFQRDSAERAEREALGRLRPFAEAYWAGDFRDPTTDESAVLRIEHFASAAELVPENHKE